MNFFQKLKNNFLPKTNSLALGATILVFAGSAFAEGDTPLANAASKAISSGSTDLQAVGLTIIGAVAGIWAIKRVIALIR